MIAGALAKHGPNRVLVTADGLAVPWKRAVNEHNIVSDIIFIRRDGWTLGAPESLENVAYQMWSDEWWGFLRKPETKVSPISLYIPSSILEEINDE